MVQGIRKISEALGDGIKKASPSEIKNINVARNSIVAAKNIYKGEKFTRNNLTMKECLSVAYDDIKNRKGKMIDGVFVKEGDD